MKYKLSTYIGYDVVGNNIVIHRNDALKMGVRVGNHLLVTGPKKSVTTAASITGENVEEGCVSLDKTLADKIGASDGETIDVTFVTSPLSMTYIRKKMDGEILTRDEINEIIKDIHDENLSYVETAMFTTAVYSNGLNVDEMAHMAEAMSDLGNKIVFSHAPIYDMCIADEAVGDAVRPIVISIAAAAGLTIPNMFHSAISNACGNAEYIKMFCNVDIGADMSKDIAENTGGCLVCDDCLFMFAEYHMFGVQRWLETSPHPFIIASMLGKKLAAGITGLVVDIPAGAGMRSASETKNYAREFTETGERLGIHVETVITDCSAPVGNAVGPKLEARECLRILEGKSDGYMAEKACELAGKLLKMNGTFNGIDTAKNILKTGKALKKFREIISAQGGNGNIKSEDIEPGEHVCRIRSASDGTVEKINGPEINAIAVRAGSPADPGAGVLLMKRVGDKVSKNDVLFEIYADEADKCAAADKAAKELNPVTIGGGRR